MNRADGTLVVTGEIAVVTFERTLGHSIDAVWSALTDPEQLAAWLGAGTIEPSPGGRVSIRTGPEGEPERQMVISGRVLAYDPPRVLEYEWTQPGLDISTVRYELQAAADTTILRLTHRRGVAPGAIGGRAGWHAYLDRLAAHLDGASIPPWSKRRAEVQGVYGEAPLRGT